MSSRLATCSRLAVAAVLLLAPLAPAAAEGIPEKPVTRDLVRRSLADYCIYGLNGREGVDKGKLVDSCTCAAERFLKTVKDPDSTTLTELPDAWIRTVTETSARCPK